MGRTDKGIVTVTTCWADENFYCPLHAVPYSPAHHFPKGKRDSGFRTKPQIAAELARTAKDTGATFRAVGRRLRLRRPGRLPQTTRRAGTAVRHDPQA
ncbi:hypothetical protein ACGFZQ_28790 [Streptomyces sp. NPDC048254]|uniref:hypothetical protein n=1 Tax=Streptomyces sp. NPDC048254 TaxID=3365525 RepID=UPI00371D9E21